MYKGQQVWMVFCMPASAGMLDAVPLHHCTSQNSLVEGGHDLGTPGCSQLPDWHESGGFNRLGMWPARQPPAGANTSPTAAALNRSPFQAALLARLRAAHNRAHRRYACTARRRPRLKWAARGRCSREGGQWEGTVSSCETAGSLMQQREAEILLPLHSQRSATVPRCA
jgi:hypothetical protein